MKNDEIKIEVYEIKKWEDKLKWNELKFEINRFAFDTLAFWLHFQQFETIRSFFDRIYTGKICLD